MNESGVVVGVLEDGWVKVVCWYGRGFNNAVNGFGDDGWESTVSDGLDDVTVMLNATTKSLEGQIASDKLLFSLGGGILCAKASMLLQVEPCERSVRQVVRAVGSFGVAGW